MEHRFEKEEKLQRWIDGVKSLPKQGTAEWLNGRKFRIGGSEVSVIEGTNHFQSKKDLIASHLGLTKFEGNSATWWGSILEDVTVFTIEKLFNCSIYVPGSVLHDIVDVHANSADGVVYIEAWDALVLIEIKNPSSRIPGGTIPGCYKSQIKSGLSTIPICDFALFIDMMQRKCELDDLRPNNRTYDTIYHNALRDRAKDPIVLTMLGIYCKDEEFDDHTNLIDYGASDKVEFENMLELVQSHTRWFVHYGEVFICDNMNTPPTPKEWRRQFLLYCREKNVKPIGIWPLKTFRLSIIPLHKEDNYIENLGPSMYEVVDTIKRLDNMSPIKQQAVLDRMFDSPEVRVENNSIKMRKLAKCGMLNGSLGNTHSNQSESKEE